MQTRRPGDDLYVHPEGAVAALAAHRADERLFPARRRHVRSRPRTGCGFVR
ncbi:hypothetical protein ACFWBX_12950 [Streptomyces sp. NPDC059991]|uniref:hypothetical protein n=1 Tax=Streptomyces sp. NPDC059991 TaxID=3347028 RepID=UPI0036B42132